ncbi:MAG: DUF3463 domain-containing protein [Archaeoglobaceae archaeon]
MAKKAALRLLKSYIKNRTSRPSPVILAHMVTYRCNMRCNYCNYWQWNSEEMSTEEIAGMLKEAADLGIAVYSATGGEPLLRRGIEEILRLSKDNGFYTMVVTNGLLLKGKRFDADLVTVSLDTLHRDEFYRITGVDALQDVLDAIEWASDQYRVTINTVLHEGNLGELEELAGFAESMGAGITFEPVSSYFEGCPELDHQELSRTAQRLLELKKEYKCILNSKAYLNLLSRRGTFNCLSHLLLRLDPDGSVIAPCYEVEGITAGNLRQQNLQELLSSEKYDQGCALAQDCRGCYLLCYAEPSMIFSDSKMAFKELTSIARKMSGFS